MDHAVRPQDVQHDAGVAASSKVLAANQGLYNGFLAAGLVWGLIAKENGTAIKIFFLGCVIVAGLFGAATAKPSILFVQALPAALALLAVLASRRVPGMKLAAGRAAAHRETMSGHSQVQDLVWQRWLDSGGASAPSWSR